jgi:hypothetical protein
MRTIWRIWHWKTTSSLEVVSVCRTATDKNQLAMYVVQNWSQEQVIPVTIWLGCQTVQECESVNGWRVESVQRMQAWRNEVPLHRSGEARQAVVWAPCQRLGKNHNVFAMRVGRVLGLLHSYTSHAD